MSMRPTSTRQPDPELEDEAEAAQHIVFLALDLVARAGRRQTLRFTPGWRYGADEATLDFLPRGRTARSDRPEPLSPVHVGSALAGPRRAAADADALQGKRADRRRRDELSPAFRRSADDFRGGDLRLGRAAQAWLESRLARSRASAPAVCQSSATRGGRCSRSWPGPGGRVTRRWDYLLQWGLCDPIRS